MDHPKIMTRCPSCGHQTLFIGSGGHLTCSWLPCKEPSPAHVIDALRTDAARLTPSQYQHGVRTGTGLYNWTGLTRLSLLHDSA